MAGPDSDAKRVAAAVAAAMPSHAIPAKYVPAEARPHPVVTLTWPAACIPPIALLCSRLPLQPGRDCQHMDAE